MLPKEKTSPFAYLLAAALVVALGVGWWLVQRKTTSTGTGSGSVIISPRHDAPPAPAAPPAPRVPAQPPSRFDQDPAVRERAIVAALNVALVAAGEKSAEHQSIDLLGVMQFTRMDPLPANPSKADLAAAIAQRRDVNEGILAGSSAFLTPGQIKVYRTVLDGEVDALVSLRANATR